MQEELDATPKEFKITCCKSYATPKGRCYTCPEEDIDKDPDAEEWK
jgi:hypothetical protein